MERKHHPYSPSTLQFLEACPAYRSKQNAEPHPRTVIGTLSHEATETGEDNPRLGDDDMEKVAECVDFFESRKSVMEAARLSQSRSEVFDLRPIVEFKETYLSVDRLSFIDGEDAIEETTGGYVDCGLISHCRTYAELFDWKFGLWPVEDARNNLQGIAYTLGLFREYPTLQSVRFFFKQPHIDNLTSHVFDRKDVPSLYLRIQVVVARARAARAIADFSTATPRVPACNFCALIGQCPAVAALACSVGNKFHPLDIPDDITPTKVHSPEDTALGLRLASVVVVWAEAFKTRVTDRILRRDAVCPDGYVIQSRTPREIVDNQKYKAVALNHLTLDEYLDTLTPLLGEAENRVKDKAVRGQKTAAVSAFKQELEDSGAVSSGAPYSFLRAVSADKEKGLE